MKQFVYSFQDKEKVSQARVKAESLAIAKAYLAKRRLTILTIKEEKTNAFSEFMTKQAISSDDIVVFTQLFAGCIRSGLTIKESLDILSKQIENRVLSNRIMEIILEVEGGTSISQAFAKHTDVFPVFFPMLVKAGEMSGDLATVLEYIGTYLERISNLRKEVIGVFTYPAVVGSVGLAMVTLILIFVAPKFKLVFGTTKMPLPMPTQVLFFLSELATRYSAMIVSVIVGLGTLFYFVNRSPKGKRALHEFYIKAPLVGRVVKETMLLRFLKAFEILVNNNVPILSALQVLEESTSNVCLKEIIMEMRKDVSKGLPISTAVMDRRDVFSPMVAYSISLGEKSGDLGGSLRRISVFIDREISFSMKKMAARLDPILTLGLGGMVLFVALAVYLPIFDMMSTTH